MSRSASACGHAGSAALTESLVDDNYSLLFIEFPRIVWTDGNAYAAASAEIFIDPCDCGILLQMIP